MPPLAIAAGIGAVGSIAGGVIASNAAKKASKTATATATANNNLQGEIYNSNKSVLEPFTTRGNAAGAQINALLGLGGSATDFAQYVNSNPDLMADYQKNYAKTTSLADYGRGHYETFGRSEGRALPTAFDAFKASAGYQAQQDAANTSVNTGYAARGALESGAAQKALQKNASVLAGNYFGQYLGALQGQQAVGAGSASALAGVGQNYAGAVTANNTAAAGVQANAGLAGAGQIASALSGVGNTALSLYGSSYGYGAGGGGASILGNNPSTIQINPSAMPRANVLSGW